jgi:hypothetical protein
MALNIQRLNFDPATGDNPSDAWRKLDNSIGEIADFLEGDGDPADGVDARLDAVEGVVAGLGNSSGKNIGTGAGTVAAGDDSRFNLGSFKNKLINGDYRFAQRGTSVAVASGASVYTLDRWLGSCTGSSMTVSRVDTGVAADRSRYVLSANVVSVAGSANLALLMQRIEDVRTYAGRTVTVSFSATSSVNNKKIGVSLDQNFGSGGSPSTAVPGVGQAVTLSTSMQRFSLTFNVPSLAGKTIGNASDFLALNFWLDAGSSFDLRSGASGQLSALVYIDQVQIEAGPVATDFEVRPYGTELTLCQRYFEKSFAPATNPAAGVQCNQRPAAAWSSSSARAHYPFKVTKRTSPALTFYAPVDGGSGAQGVIYSYSGAVWAAVSVSPVATSLVQGEGFSLDFPASLAAGSTYLVAINWTADSEL